jgi:hypothetical protein
MLALALGRLLSVQPGYRRSFEFRTPGGVTRPMANVRFMAPAAQQEQTFTLSFRIDGEGRPAAARVEEPKTPGLESAALPLVRGAATLELVSGSVGERAVSPSRTAV